MPKHTCNHRIILLALVSSLISIQPVGYPQSPLSGLDKLPVNKELPDPFLMNDGKRVKNKADWARRREELKEMILYYEYGHLAPAPNNLSTAELSSKNIEELGAEEKQLLLSMGPSKKVEFHLILTIPPGKGPFPVIVKGDLCWGRVAPAMVAAAVKRGYIVAEFDRTELAPDSTDRTKGVFPTYPDYDWTVLGAWAWGFHRTVDYLMTQIFADPKHIAITGHSRGGKAALLAGALDDRVALTAPNGSGCGGAGSYRVLGEKCEDMAAITNRFPYWFQPRLKEFIAHVDQLPFDQHSVRALVAPRAQLSTEGLSDLWANPMGTQVTYIAARQVYEFLGAGERIGIHFREGKHEQNAEDWKALLDFADLQFLGKKTETRFDRLAFPDAPKAFTWSAPKTR
jgi:dienelactone hydrolase